MECGKRRIKILFHSVNFIFVLCGLAYLIIGVSALIRKNYNSENLNNDSLNLTSQISITFIVIGSIIVFIAFLGCYSAIRKNYCMIVTFASLLLIILIIQVIVVIYIFVTMNDSDGSSFNKSLYTMYFNYYPKGGRIKENINITQKLFKCCGVDGPDDFARLLGIPIPGTCCDKSMNDICDQIHSYKTGCGDVFKNLAKENYTPGDIIFTIIEISIVLINIIFALCLANSIKNAKRRGQFV